MTVKTKSEYKSEKTRELERAAAETKASDAALRDLFAAHALTGLISLQHADVCEHVARKAYAAADAMLAVRDEDSEGPPPGDETEVKP